MNLVQPLVIAVVLNWHGKDDTMRCVESLVRQTYPRLHILVVDNGSFDGALESASARWSCVETLQIERNLGYAGGNNVAIARALAQGADVVFVVNSDVTLDEMCVELLVEHSGPDVAALGPTVCDPLPSPAIQSAGGYYQRWRGRHPYCPEARSNTPRPVDWLSGCAVMMTRNGIERVGLFDEMYFAYFEDLDWCLRAGEAGLRVVHVPDAKVRHRDLLSKSDLEQFLVGRNAISAAVRHCRGFQCVTSVFYISAIATLKRAAVSLSDGNIPGAIAAVKGPLWHVRLFRKSNPLAVALRQ